jgi:hypothetical protein
MPPSEKRVGLVALTGLALAFSWIAPFTLIQSAPADLAAQVDASGAWQLPDPLPRFATLDPDTWVGQPIGATQLAVWLDVEQQMTEGTWILYRVACDHCAAYLRHLHDTFDPGAGKIYTYVRLSEEGEEERREVDAGHLAFGPEVILPALDWVVTPPWRLELEGGVVKQAVFEGDFEERLAESPK